MTFQCQYCNKTFKREKTLVVHLCEQKRRHLAFNDKDVQLGFHTYNKFYQYSQDKNKIKTPIEFMKSPYYTAFVKFGKYIVDTQCIKIERFIIFVIKSGIKLDIWAKDSTYTKFLDQAIRTEALQDALLRATAYSEEWAAEKEMQPKDFFRYGSESRICHAIVSGHISPWVVYQSESGQKFLEKLTSEQMSMIWDVIDPDFWNNEFTTRADDVEDAKLVLGNLGW